MNTSNPDNPAAITPRWGAAGERGGRENSSDGSRRSFGFVRACFAYGVYWSIQYRHSDSPPTP